MLWSKEKLRLRNRFEDSFALGSFLFGLIISFYRLYLAGFFGGNCRFYPSCSCYAQQAVEQHTFFVAFKLVVGRLLRCHPFSGCYGFDPVPNPTTISRGVGA